MQLPNARRERILVEELAEETLVYDLDNHKAHSLNATAALVWKHCDGATSVGEVARIMHDELNAPPSEDLVLLAVERLRAAKLLADDAPKTGESISRRAVMKKLALVGGLTVLLPAIHSIVAPTPAQAQTCIGPGTLPPGAACTNNDQCCSNACDQGTLRCL